MADNIWIQNRLKSIIYQYGEAWFSGKKVLDVGAGHGQFAIALANLGASVTCIDARKQHLDYIRSQNHTIRCLRANLDQEWPLHNESFDLTLHLGTLNHLKEIEHHLQIVCQTTDNLVLDTEVCDSTDPNHILYVKINKGNLEFSFNGMGCKPSPAYVERLLNHFGMEYTIVSDDRCNSKIHFYDWQEKNTGIHKDGLCRMWFAKRHTVQDISGVNHILSKPKPIDTSTVIAPPVSFNTASMGAVRDLTTVAPKIYQPEVVVENTGPIFVTSAPKTKKFVIVVPSYKNEKWCEKNIQSCIDQNYDHYRVIFTDDCSPDGTFDKVKSVVEKSGKSSKFTLIKNTTRKGALENLYDMIHSCADDEIILTLDGDDWLAHREVLTKLDQVYGGNDVWMSYGQYINHPDNGKGIASQYPHNIIESNSFRRDVWRASHLRTFYAWLFKRIKKEHLMWEGKFLTMTWDLGIMFGMLEMSGHRSRFISDILYTYNLDNPINDHKVDRGLQAKLDRYIRSLPRYQRINNVQTVKTKVGLLLIATNKYTQYLQGIISSADKYFLGDNANVTYYVFTDQNPVIGSKRNVVYLPIEHRPFPHASMDRFKHFTTYAERLKDQDYLFYCDVDSLFVDFISNEIFGNLVGVRHCGYTKTKGTYETNPLSTSYVPIEKQKYYFGGGFSGGKAEKYLELARRCRDALDEDDRNNIIPIYHDESILNKYFSEHEPDVILSPSHHYPQSNVDRYKKLWAPDVYRPKILLLDKNHDEMRK